MKVTINLVGVDEVLKEWAESENDTLENAITIITLQHLRTFMRGQLSGQKKHHAGVMERMNAVNFARHPTSIEAGGAPGAATPQEERRKP